MMFSRVLMMFIAAGALLGGADKILGNRFGLGQKFDDGFLLMGPMALTMTGIICLAPLLSDWLGVLVRPVLSAAGIDPAMFGCVLAIDMGGYQLAMDLAQNEQIGLFSGIIAASMFGCTLVFTIPVSMSVLKDADRPFFLKGLLAGLISLPVGLLVGGLLQGLPAGTVCYQCIPIFILSALLLLGLILICVPAPHTGHFEGISKLPEESVTAMHLGMILFAFITSSPHPSPMPSRSISLILHKEALETVVPSSCTGSKTATGEIVDAAQDHSI